MPDPKKFFILGDRYTLKETYYYDKLLVATHVGDKLSMRATTLSIWNSNRARLTPSTFQTRVYGAVLDSCYFSPSRQATAVVADRKYPITSGVSCLFRLGAPFHIPFLVMTVIVFAIQRMFWAWSPSDLCQKFIERFKAELNTTFAVVGIGCVGRLFATSFGMAIRSIFWRCRSVNTLAVGKVERANVFISHTTTRCRMSVPQITGRDETNFSAITETMPLFLATRFRPCVTKHGQQGISIMRKINETTICGVGCKNEIRDVKILVGHIFSLTPKNVIRLGLV